MSWPNCSLGVVMCPAARACKSMLTASNSVRTSPASGRSLLRMKISRKSRNAACVDVCYTARGGAAFLAELASVFDNQLADGEQRQAADEEQAADDERGERAGG